MTDMQPEPAPEPASGEALDDQARDTVTVEELVRQAGAEAFEPVPLEPVEGPEP